MRLCFVVNDVRTQRATYSTLHIALEAQRRGHDVRFVGVGSMTCSEDGRVSGDGKTAPGAELGALAAALRSSDTPSERIVLDEFDVVFLRNNPNVGGAHHNPAIDFGRRLKGRAIVVNDPDGLARAGSKMYLAGFPEEVRPRTLITRSASKIKDFLRELDGPAILKPLAGYGGKDVFYVRRRQVANLNQMIAAVAQGGYVIAQEYLAAVARGDKRVLLLDGAPIRVGRGVAAYKRMRPKDDIRNNMHVGGTRKRCAFTEVEERICALLAPRLSADGLYFVGVDVVGDKVLEINVFAPGGIHNINELYGVNVGERIVEDLEKRVAVRSAYDGAWKTGSIR